MKVNDLVVGSGLFGAVYAREAMDAGRSVAVIEKRNHIGGNVYTKKISGIDVHIYGAHIFHTSDKEVWEYVNRFAEFNNYINSPIAIYGDELYNLPFNMNTFSKMWGIKTPAEAKAKIAEQIKQLNITNPKNLEEQALSLVGSDVYEKLIKGYTQKQWGRPCTELPSFIIKRIPLRFTYDNNYFTDRYQGIPVDGYTAIVEKLLKGADVFLNEDFKDFKKKHTLSDGTEIEYDRLIYTGQVDEYFDYTYGPLSWRSVRFETEELDTDNYQGNAVVNYTSADVPYTRIIEHKHFNFGKQPTTIISREYSHEWKPGEEPYYPVNDEQNTALYERYASLAEDEKKKNVYFGGRLGQYKYYNMDQVIAEALKLSEELL
ncbi:MAG: UDP-galactopyranose mutase [Lachnospiraceae bacterium]|uniref:UDP-galactopyranose mutase n=1 Tax=Candidatus Weimeria bifida TaxID=2599074 RepID=A0A6N7J011_9FIRM|nr:UDP-galactopyranose mutase [Candidatus Weimeria bifida]RRF96441.1 MAG: UDP-galactopyranose mutase [Lachnospiraceae bacterium]